MGGRVRSKKYPLCQKQPGDLIESTATDEDRLAFLLSFFFPSFPLTPCLILSYRENYPIFIGHPCSYLLTLRSQIFFPPFRKGGPGGIIPFKKSPSIPL